MSQISDVFTRGQTVYYLDPIGIKSYPALALLSPGLGYGIFLCHLAVPVSLCHCITSLASFSSGYGDSFKGGHERSKRNRIKNKILNYVLKKAIFFKFI